MAIDADWNLTVHDGRNRHTFSATEIISWGAHRDPKGKSLVFLTSGGFLAGDVISIDRDHLTIKRSGTLDLEKLRLEHVRAIMISPPADLLERDRLADRLNGDEHATDLLFLKNSDQVTGTFVGSSARDEDENYQIEIDGRPIDIPRDKVVAISLKSAIRATHQPSERHAYVGLRDGSFFVVDGITTESNQVHLRVPGGMVVDVPAYDRERPFDAITYLRPENPRVQYLSDLKPISYKHIPYLTVSWPYSNDRNVLSGQLRANGLVFRKGLGMHSASVLAYELGGKHRRFEADLAIDQLANRQGSVTYQVFLFDSSGKRSIAFRSKIIRGGQPPQPISVDVSESHRMALLVDFADRGDVWDHANWLNARLIQ